MIVGTAGHIDHGKTTLVRALTGVDTDRLKEEKARGISIELGYAYTSLNNGDVLGFVDVPGHERLVHTMAAGACGIDFALLVVAADDGVMPQTREHVAILQLFGVTRGAVALTKVDRVDAARARAAEAEVRAFLASTVFAAAPVFRVNAAVDGDDGVRLLKEHLEGVAIAGRQGPEVGNSGSRSTQSGESGDCGLAARDLRLFRLAVDRVFTLPGHGTVVAGTVFSGSVRVGDTIAALPSDTPVRVRSIHSQNRGVEVGHSGERCALTLSGIERSQINRGDWLADGRVFTPTTRVDVRLELLQDGNIVLKSWSPVHVHHGAAHLTAHIVPLDTDQPATPEVVRNQPAQSRHAQLVFETPVCAMPGDRFVLRDARALHTIGGGIVLDPYAPSRKRRSPERLRYLTALERMNSGEGVRPLLTEAPHGIRQSELIRLCGQGSPTLPPDALVVEGSREHYVFLVPAWYALRERAVQALRDFHVELPDEPGPDLGRLRRIAFPQLSNDLWQALTTELIADGLVLRSGPWLYLPGHTVSLSETEKALAGRLQPLIAAGRFNPPWVRDLASVVREPEDRVRQVLRKQVTQGRVYQVVHDLFYDRQCVEELATLVTRLADEHGTVEAAQYRDVVGLGRKRAIQILEFFDRVGHTRRIRDSRILRSDSAWRAA
jgi:selenocysteine-specific elongation factor